MKLTAPWRNERSAEHRQIERCKAPINRTTLRRLDPRALEAVRRIFHGANT